MNVKFSLLCCLLMKHYAFISKGYTIWLPDNFFTLKIFGFTDYIDKLDPLRSKRFAILDKKFYSANFDYLFDKRAN